MEQLQNLFKDPMMRLALDIFTLISGFVAIIQLGELLIKFHHRLLTITTPLIIIASGFGMSQLLGFVKQDILLGIWGSTLAIITYISPPLIPTLFKRHNWFLPATLIILYIPAFFLCSIFLFSTSLSFLLSKQNPNPPSAPIWIIFTVLEAVYILGVIYFFKVQSKYLDK